MFRGTTTTGFSPGNSWTACSPRTADAPRNSKHQPSDRSASGSSEVSTPVASEIRVRAMRSADLDAVARLHSLAFAGYFLTHLGPGFLRRLYAGFLEKPGFP